MHGCDHAKFFIWLCRRLVFVFSTISNFGLSFSSRIYLLGLHPLHLICCHKTWTYVGKYGQTFAVIYRYVKYYVMDPWQGMVTNENCLWWGALDHLADQSSKDIKPLNLVSRLHRPLPASIVEQVSGDNNAASLSHIEWNSLRCRSH